MIKSPRSGCAPVAARDGSLAVQGSRTGERVVRRTNRTATQDSVANVWPQTVSWRISAARASGASSSEAWLREGVVAETQPPRDLTAPLGVRGIKRSLLEVAGQGLTGSVCIRFVPQADDVPRSVLFRQQVPRLLSASSRALGSAARLATR
jgi:hypothetical protein